MEQMEPKEMDGTIKHLMDVIRITAAEKGSEQSFYVADLADIVQKYQVWKSLLPRVHPFYAVKCNSDLQVLRLMRSLGVHFDCASKKEIDVVLSVGAKPSHIIYAHPYKSHNYVCYARAAGVDCMTFDSESELLKIKELHPKARLVIRFRVPKVAAGFPLNKKFGCELNDCRRLLQLARQLQLDVIGACFHVGGLCQEPEAYARAISMARQVFDVANEIGYSFTLLDLGGGYPGDTGYYEMFRKMSCYINEALEEHFPEEDYSNLQVIAEPGCYFICSAFTLCTTIVGKKELTVGKEKDEGKVKIMYYLNDGFYMSFPEGVEKYKSRMLPLLSEKEAQNRRLLTSKLWGATCCSSDYIVKKCLMPEMEIGEHIVFRNMGAYTLSLSTNFNGFPTPSIKYVYLNKRNTDVPKCLQYGEPLLDCSTTKKVSFIKVPQSQPSDDEDELCRNG